MNWHRWAARLVLVLACSATAASIWVAVGVASFAPASASGLKGRVQAGPTCPVESQPPQPQCAPRPVEATLRIYPVGERSEYVLAHSGKRGWFHIVLAPARYVVHAERVNRSGFPRPPAPFRVTVKPGQFTHITVNYDTGLR